MELWALGYETDPVQLGGGGLTLQRKEEIFMPLFNQMNIWILLISVHKDDQYLFWK